MLFILFMKFYIILLITSRAFASHSIEDFGAVPNVPDIDVARKNSEAFLKAINAANEDPIDRVALVPVANLWFVFNVTASNLFNVTIRIEGALMISNNITEWENIMGHPTAQHFRLAMLMITVNKSNRKIFVYEIASEILWANFFLIIIKKKSAPI